MGILGCGSLGCGPLGCGNSRLWGSTVYMYYLSVSLSLISLNLIFKDILNTDKNKSFINVLLLMIILIQNICGIKGFKSCLSFCVVFTINTSYILGNAPTHSTDMGSNMSYLVGHHVSRSLSARLFCFIYIDL